MKIPNSTICLFKFYSLPLMTVLQMFFALCSMSKIKISDGIKVISFSIKKVWKMFFESVGTLFLVEKLHF